MEHRNKKLHRDFVGKRYLIGTMEGKRTESENLVEIKMHDIKCENGFVHILHDLVSLPKEV